MLIKISLLIICSILCGGGNKYADLFNEHGLKLPYKYADHIWGIIWGGAGAYLVYLDPSLAIMYTATTLYWFLRVKLEYFNHAFAGVLMIIVAFIEHGSYFQTHIMEFIYIFLGYTITGYIQKYLKDKKLNLWWLWKLRIRIYLVPLVYSIAINNYLPITVTFIAMIANEFVRYKYKTYENDISLEPQRKVFSDLV